VAGAIVNQVASDRHAGLIREGFARASVPLLGLVRRDPAISLPSRHLGLVQAEEHHDLARKIERAGELVTAGCDLDAIIAAAAPISPPRSCGERLGEGPRHARSSSGPGHSNRSTRWEFAPRRPSPNPTPQGRGEVLPPFGQRIAIARDVAFAFAYPHFLADWRDAGAEISFFSPLADEAPTADADAVFLPGGYPELHAGRLASAANFRAGMEAAARRGALIYGECGGYMVLGGELVDADGAANKMLGLLPVSTSFERKKLHLGYRRLQPLDGLPWPGALAAHEFHFASILAEGAADPLFAAEAADGKNLGPVGLRRGRVMGSFAHVIDRAP
jgi:cobyrinic acid a,c-diamide synthase